MFQLLMLVEYLVIAVEKAVAIPFNEPIELVVREQPASDERLLEGLVVDGPGAELGPHAVESCSVRTLTSTARSAQLLAVRVVVIVAWGCLETVPRGSR